MYLVKGHKGTFYIRYLKPNGKYTMLTTKEQSKPKARKVLEAFKLSLIKPTTPAINYTLRDLSDKLNSFTFSNKENLGYNKLLQRFEKYTDKFHLNDIKNEDCEHYKIERAKNFYRGHIISKASVNADLRCLKATFNKAIRWGIMKSNPMKGIRFYKRVEKERLSFKQFEINKLLSSVDNKYLKRIFEFGFLTGCRLNEIVHIQWKDVDWENKIISINNKHNFTTKSGNIRKIPMSDSLFQFLLIIKNENKIYDLEGYIFPKENGYPFFANHVSKKFKYYIRQSQLSDKFHFHCTRHTFATQYLRSGGSIYNLQKLLGHCSITVTEGYLHYVTDDAREDLNRMNLINY